MTKMADTFFVRLTDVPPALEDFDTGEKAAPPSQVTMMIEGVHEKLLQESMFVKPGAPIFMNFDCKRSNAWSDEPPDQFNMFINVSIDQAKELADNLMSAIIDYQTRQISVLNDRQTLVAAGLACLRGYIGEMRLTCDAPIDSLTGDHMTGTFKIEYIAKKESKDEPDAVMFEILNQPLQEMKWRNHNDELSYLRALVGGNHDFTSKIKVTFKGFAKEG
jgi:hypothetical protein